VSVPPCPTRAPSVPPARDNEPCPRAPLYRHGHGSRPLGAQNYPLPVPPLLTTGEPMLEAPSAYGDTCPACRRVVEPCQMTTGRGRWLALYAHCGGNWTRGYAA
jgi:hypothetical protein